MAVFGGVKKQYPIDKIYEEMAFISYYFHWSQDVVMHLEHAERVRWCKEISAINEKTSPVEKKQNVFDI
ncbi:MAG: DUF6760 family protein [Bacillota bacterium]